MTSKVSPCALLGQIDVAPAGEQVFQIPFALAVTDEHEKTVGHFKFPYLFVVMPGLVPGILVFLMKESKTWMAGSSPAMTMYQKSCSPSTSIIE